VKKIDTLEDYIKFGTKLIISFHMRKKKGESKIGHGKNEKKDEFGSP
jgi:hypothetical protein